MPDDDLLLDRVWQHAEQAPQMEACFRVRPTSRGLTAEPITYGQIVRRAAGYAASLRRTGLGEGDRLLISMADPHGLLCCMLGAMARGIIPVPLQGRGDFVTDETFRLRVRAVKGACEPRLAVVDRREAWCASLAGTGGEELPVAEARQLQGRDDGAPLRADRALDPDACAFIQYTSGSCGAPKGNVITHRNLAANMTAIGESTGASAGDRVFSWLPLHHDMGLIGALLFPVHRRIPTFIMPPLVFLASPATWLRGIHAFRATMIVAPTFAYSLCVNKVPERLVRGLDLSSCRVAFCGAEPIPARMVDAFVERFEPHGFRRDAFFPVYGLAEATLAATFPACGQEPVFITVDRERLAREGRAVPVPAEAPGAARYVSVGRALRGHALRVVDPRSGEPCPEGNVGEIRVSGPSVSPRYYTLSGMGSGMGTETGGAAGPRKELRTGDLGFLVDGQLFVVDRLKDLVIIGGRNFAPSDLEAALASVPGLRPGRIVALSAAAGEDDVESLHVVAELSPGSWRSQRRIREAIALRVRSAFGLEVRSVTIIPPGTLPKTSSGKVKRGACRRDVLERGQRRIVPLAGRAAIKYRLLARRVAGLLWALRRPDGLAAVETDTRLAPREESDGDDARDHAREIAREPRDAREAREADGAAGGGAAQGGVPRSL